MDRPALSGWILDNDAKDPLSEPAVVSSASGGVPAVPFFLKQEHAVAQCEWLNKMYPDGPLWVITEAALVGRD